MVRGRLPTAELHGHKPVPELKYVEVLGLYTVIKNAVSKYQMRKWKQKSSENIMNAGYYVEPTLYMLGKVWYTVYCIKATFFCASFIYVNYASQLSGCCINLYPHKYYRTIICL